MREVPERLHGYEAQQSAGSADTQNAIATH